MLLYLTAFTQRFFLRNEIVRLFIYSICFSLVLALVAVLRTGIWSSLFLVWNLFLAAVPFLISNWLFNRQDRLNHPGKWIPAALLWLLFIPNSFYILTDLFHLGAIRNFPLWFQLILLLSFAWNGMLLGIFSLRQMEKLATHFLGAYTGQLFVLPVLFLNSLGVYIGRYLRYNSWDVIANPVQLATDMTHLLFHPYQYRNAWAMVGCFFVMLYLFYAMLKRVGRLVRTMEDGGLSNGSAKAANRN